MTSVSAAGGGILLEREDSLETTGNQLWNAARVLLSCLEQQSAESEFAVLSRSSNARILELGAGIGWLAVSLALNRNVTVCATDQAAQLPLLRRNVELNAALCLSRVSVEQLDFFDECATSHFAHSIGNWSLIVASDVVYSLPLAAAFAKTAARLLDTTSATMLYAHTFGRYTDVDQELIGQLRAVGLVVTLLVESKEEPLESQWSSNGEFELFADQITRCLIVRRRRESESKQV
jgi:hypothetical protein